MRVVFGLGLAIGAVVAACLTGGEAALDCPKLRNELRLMHRERDDAESAGDADRVDDITVRIHAAHWQYRTCCRP